MKWNKVFSIFELVSIICKIWILYYEEKYPVGPEHLYFAKNNCHCYGLQIVGFSVWFSIQV